MKAVWTIIVAASFPVVGLVGCSGETPAIPQKASAAQEEEEDEENGSGTKSAAQTPADSPRQ